MYSPRKRRITNFHKINTISPRVKQWFREFERGWRSQAGDRLDSNLERQAVANYPVIRPSVSRVIRIIVGASVEINLYQFTAAMPVHSNGCRWNWFSLPGDKSYPSTGDLPSRRGGGGGRIVVLVEVQPLWKPFFSPRIFMRVHEGSKYLRGTGTKYWSSNRDEARLVERPRARFTLDHFHLFRDVDRLKGAKKAMRVDLPLCTLFRMELCRRFESILFFLFLFFRRHDCFRITFVKCNFWKRWMRAYVH